jgi:DNA polymerase-3 subunit delta'
VRQAVHERRLARAVEALDGDEAAVHAADASGAGGPDSLTGDRMPLGLDDHPHAAAVLGSALPPAGQPSHAYLLHGPAGTGKRAAARAFAAELLADGARDPASARARVASGAHPDLAWVTPSGAHEMLRRDVDEAVVSAAARTPFEATRRVFVLERCDTMNDEAANRLLKTLEEPASYVVLLLLTDRPDQLLPTVASRCQAVRFDPLTPEAIAARLESRGVQPPEAGACARLGLGDAERALGLALGDGPALRAQAENFARAAIHGVTGAKQPWAPILATAQARGRAAEAELEAALADELETLAKSERRKRETEYADRAKRASRRARTEALDLALQLAGLWFRDLACVTAGVPDLVHHTDRLESLSGDAERIGNPAAVRRALELVEETRARLALNVSEDLALEALAYRLEAALASRQPVTVA